MSVTVTRLAGLVAACVAVGGFALASPAGAAGHPTTTRGLHATLAGPAAHPTRGLSPKTAIPTTYGAGYFMYPDQGLASVSATFTMPSITCVHPGDNEWLLPGIWVYSAGALSEQVDVNFNCNKGVLLQEGIICLASSCDQSLAVAPGDKIVTSLAYTPTATIGTVKDVTAGTRSQVSVGAITTDDTVFVGDAGPVQFLGGAIKNVPQFTKVRFSSVQFNGEYLTDAPGLSQFNLKTRTALQISSTPVQADGESFSTSFVHT